MKRETIPLRTHCIECGCHDLAACFDEEKEQPCSWLVVDRAAGIGVCSACRPALKRWKAGDRSIAVPIDRDGRRPAPSVATHRSIPSIKRAMAKALCEWIEEEKMNQEQAADKLMLHRPRISDLQRGRLDKFSVDALLTYLWRAGLHVQITLK